MNMKDKSVRLSSKRDKSQTVQNAVSRNVAKSIKKLLIQIGLQMWSTITI